MNQYPNLNQGYKNNVHVNNYCQQNVCIDFQGNHNQENQQIGRSLKNLNVRLGFIRKVYGILTVQMFFTLIICAITMTSQQVKDYLKGIDGRVFIVMCFVLNLMTAIILLCNRKIAQHVPYNYVLLAVFTITEGFIVGLICAATEPTIVLMAASSTLGVTIALTIYAVTTKNDITMKGGSIFVVAMSFFIFGVFVGLTDIKIGYILLDIFGVILFSIYLIYDTQLIVGGNSRELDIDEYVFASLMLYMDIINLFLYLLSLLSKK